MTFGQSGFDEDEVQWVSEKNTSPAPSCSEPWRQKQDA